MALSTFTILYNHHLCVVPEHFITPKGNSLPLSSHSPFPLLAPGNHQSAFCLWICLFWTFHINGIIQHMTFYVWLFQRILLKEQLGRAGTEVGTVLLHPLPSLPPSPRLTTGTCVIARGSPGLLERPLPACPPEGQTSPRTALTNRRFQISQQDRAEVTLQGPCWMHALTCSPLPPPVSHLSSPVLGFS